MMRSLGTHSTNSNGPVPVGWRLMSLPHLASAFGLLNIARRPASVCRRAPLGSLSVILRVCLSTASTLSTLANCERVEQAIGLVEPAIEIDLGGLGVEFLAVVELDALPELPREDLPAVGDRPRLRELRHQLLVLVPAHEAFEHHALHEHRGHVAGGGGIEARGVRLGRHHDGPTARLRAGHGHGHGDHQQQGQGADPARLRNRRFMRLLPLGSLRPARAVTGSRDHRGAPSPVRTA